MKTITKILAVIPLAAVVAACNGVSPTAPGNPLVADEGSALSQSEKAGVAPECRTIAGVDLRLVPMPGRGDVVEATYLKWNGSPVRCVAPLWVSEPRGLLTPEHDLFRVRVNPHAGTVTVLATAPNGVKGRLVIPGGRADISTSAACAGVAGVNLVVEGSTNDLQVQIRATYLRLGPSLSTCAAPAWTSQPRGALTPTKDPFVVAVAPIRPVTVTATAPNGVRGTRTLYGRVTDLEASAACKQVTGVQVKVVPSTLPGATLLEATYLQFGPSLGNCPAPKWSSDPRGILSPTKNPFRVHVSAVRPATVTATAPSGIRGEITLQK